VAGHSLPGWDAVDCYTRITVTMAMIMATIMTVS
jgi:hypothetical protein